ncbi:MAG: 50S ribosomal protein L5 [Acidimicrobiia bacterium]|nr:50S ribosomal protein L5 [bacterium]MCY3653356.1 50S ribosomal protein L5 [bacterium]MDE0644130.1 50S ribosomal protein L5 [bacterium]MXZ05989.1 50S ribosomal protein L5 [Acidimicrobiia bacterium]MYH55075.1 50S ribosomal protein L5 [Acidimicrobiia bacterium]
MTADKASSATGYVPRLKLQYQDGVRSRLLEELGLGNPMLIPNLEKIVVNMGVGESVGDRKQVGSAMEDLSTITGQKPRLNRARRSIAGFKLRTGMPVGCSVTIRGDRAWEFLDRLITVAIPRIRDFRGLKPSSFDGRGNYSFGVSEQLIFPEIDYDKVTAVRGMDITICTTSKDDRGAQALLEAFGFPFRRQNVGAG